jgi:hypothetical protein
MKGFFGSDFFEWAPLLLQIENANAASHPSRLTQTKMSLCSRCSLLLVYKSLEPKSGHPYFSVPFLTNLRPVLFVACGVVGGCHPLLRVSNEQASGGSGWSSASQRPFFWYPDRTPFFTISALFELSPQTCIWIEATSLQKPNTKISGRPRDAEQKKVKNI